MKLYVLKVIDDTVASLWVFMQKECTHQKAVKSITAEPKGYIPRKFMCQLMYRELEKVKGLSQKQYAAAVKKYPILGQLYSLLKEFHRIVFLKKRDELDEWFIKPTSLNIE